MSNALAIAGVTAVLRNLLNTGLRDQEVSGIVGSDVDVSVLPPDRVVSGEGAEASQLNLFLHKISPNTGWLNEGLPSCDASGLQRLSNPPLPLNLHYLISAYGSADFHAEILLGYAMHLIHENPVFSRKAIRSALTPTSDPATPLQKAIMTSGLADQIEQIKITPEYLNSEEMSKLWTATQAHYRPTTAYQVSVVLIESDLPAHSPLPVLTRGKNEQGREQGIISNPSLIPMLPTIEAVAASDGQSIVLLGETVHVTGHHLKGDSREIRLINERFDKDELLATLPPAHPPKEDESALVKFEIPAARADYFPVGVYQVSVRLILDGEDDSRESNRLALVLAPELTTQLPMAIQRDSNGTASFSLEFMPDLQDGQKVMLVLGQQEIAPRVFTAPVSKLDFVIDDAPTGDHLVRLRIDGIDSPIVDRSQSPPRFLNRIITIS